MTATTRRIYVACLAAYNNGTLHGAWIETEGKDADELREEVAAILRASPSPNVTVTCPDCDGKGGHFETMTLPAQIAGRTYTTPQEWVLCPTCGGSGEVPSSEEFALHDHEGFGGVLGEYTSLDEVAQLDALLEEHGEAFLAFLKAFGVSRDQWDRFDDAYYGTTTSEAAFAEEYAVDVGHIKPDDHMYSYIDWDHYWNGCLRFDFTIEDGYVFNANW